MKDIRAKTYPNARLSRSTRRTTSSCPKNGRSTLAPGCRATSWRKANTGNTRKAADLTRRGRKGRRRAPARNGSAGGRLGIVVLLLVLILRERAGVPRGAELSVVVFRALQPGSTQPFGCHDDEEAAHQPEGCEDDWHTSSQSVQRADVLLVGLYVDSSRTKEQRDLHDGVVGDVQYSAGHCGRGQQ